jgi:uncharacterized protein
MIKLVLDTNVVVSSVINGKGVEARVFDLAVNRAVGLYVSQPILDEYEGVLSRTRFHLSQTQVQSILGLVRTSSTLVKPTQKVTVSPDEPDNRFLECAESAKANYLVTGNKRHFPKRWKMTAIVNAREFLELITIELDK